MTDQPSASVQKKSRLPIIAGLLTVLVVVIGFAAYRAISSLDGLIQSGVERYGPDIMGAEVQLEGVTVNLADGAAELRGLVIGNPEGFQTERAVKVDRIALKLDLQSLTQPPIVIREVRIEAPDVIYESGGGGSNLDRLQQNIRAYTGTTDAPAQEQEAATRMIIEDLYINDGHVSISHSAFKGKKIRSPLPQIHMKDIGKEEGGASPGDVAKEVFGKVQSGASSVAGKSIDTIRSGASTLMEKGKDAAAGATEAIKGLFDRD